MKEISKLPIFNGNAPAGRPLWTPLLGLSAAVVFLAGCHKAHQGHPAAEPEPSVRVRTQTAEAKPLGIVEEVVGTMRARLRATIESKTTGRIIDMPVVMGQRVKAGGTACPTRCARN